jgi:hypothetical protein
MALALMLVLMSSTPLQDGDVFFGEPSDPRVVGRGAGVFSISNDNSRFAAVVALAELPSASPRLFLRGRAIRASSTGSGFQGLSAGAATFELDAELAGALAKAWKVQLRRRVPLGERVTATLHLAGEYRRGEPMPVELVLVNGGPETVYVSVGGRQRGLRDNRFRFTSPQGAQQPEAPDFGGLMTYRALEPGAALTLSEDLSRWLRFDEPGHVSVEVSYEAELVSAPDGAPWPDRGQEKWDKTLRATGSTTLR